CDNSAQEIRKQNQAVICQALIMISMRFTWLQVLLLLLVAAISLAPSEVDAGGFDFFAGSGRRHHGVISPGFPAMGKRRPAAPQDEGEPPGERETRRWTSDRGIGQLLMRQQRPLQGRLGQRFRRIWWRSAA
ncbi:hypothetical protein BOX15_Mlig029622g1, partial [Macrostomum lignano]